MEFVPFQSHEKTYHKFKANAFYKYFNLLPKIEAVIKDSKKKKGKCGCNINIWLLLPSNFELEYELMIYIDYHLRLLS